MFITLQEGGKFAPGVIKCKVTHNFYLSTAFPHIFFDCGKIVLVLREGFITFVVEKKPKSHRWSVRPV